MKDGNVGVLGARSLVGDCLLPLLLEQGWRVTALSRRTMESNHPNLEWREWPARGGVGSSIGSWISLLPIWLLPGFFPLLEQCGARRVVALSSTSRFAKTGSPDPGERSLAAMLVDGERALDAWAGATGKEWVVLRPTLIYGLGRDRNISEMARLIRRYGFFPLAGTGGGLRQPVHARDVAAACAAAVAAPAVGGRAYDISGADTLAYRDMVGAVFDAVGVRRRFVPLPPWCVGPLMSLIRHHPRYRHWSAAMFQRMGQDLVFDHSPAARDLAFHPQGFALSREDVPA